MLPIFDVRCVHRPNPTFDVANRRTRRAGCKRCNALVKVDRAVQTCADLNDQDRLRSSRRFDSNPIYQDRIRSEFSTRIGSNLNFLYFILEYKMRA